MAFVRCQVWPTQQMTQTLSQTFRIKLLIWANIFEQFINKTKFNSQINRDKNALHFVGIHIASNVTKCCNIDAIRLLCGVVNAGEPTSFDFAVTRAPHTK